MQRQGQHTHRSLELNVSREVQQQREEQQAASQQRKEHDVVVACRQGRGTVGGLSSARQPGGWAVPHAARKGSSSGGPSLCRRRSSAV